MLPDFQTGTPTRRARNVGQRATLFTVPYSSRQLEGTTMVNSHPDSASTSAKNCWLTGFMHGWLTISSFICLLLQQTITPLHMFFNSGRMRTYLRSDSVGHHGYPVPGSKGHLRVLVTHASHALASNHYVRHQGDPQQLHPS